MGMAMVNGPPCTNCGCRDCKILQESAEVGEESLVVGGNPETADRWQRSAWWGSGRARCNHCRTEFAYREVKTNAESSSVDAAKTICPECDGKKYYVYKTKGEKKYRKCRDCGHTKD